MDHPAIDAIGVPLCEEPHPRCPAHLVPPVHGVAPTCYITVGRKQGMEKGLGRKGVMMG